MIILITTLKNFEILINKMNKSTSTIDEKIKDFLGVERWEKVIGKDTPSENNAVKYPIAMFGSYEDYINFITEMLNLNILKKKKQSLFVYDIN